MPSLPKPKRSLCSPKFLSSIRWTIPWTSLRIARSFPSLQTLSRELSIYQSLRIWKFSPWAETTLRELLVLTKSVKPWSSYGSPTTRSRSWRVWTPALSFTPSLSLTIGLSHGTKLPSWRNCPKSKQSLSSETLFMEKSHLRRSHH